jgi:UDP-N-acetylglucosamine:LPS N-acetylglucosamine transferase
VSEVIAAQMCAIFIPSPYVVKNHQYKNIEPLIKEHAAFLLQENELSKESLLLKINEILNDEALISATRNNMLAFQTPHAVDDFVTMIENMYE